MMGLIWSEFEQPLGFVHEQESDSRSWLRCKVHLPSYATEAHRSGASQLVGGESNFATQEWENNRLSVLTVHIFKVGLVVEYLQCAIDVCLSGLKFLNCCFLHAYIIAIHMKLQESAMAAEAKQTCYEGSSVQNFQFYLEHSGEHKAILQSLHDILPGEFKRYKKKGRECHCLFSSFNYFHLLPRLSRSCGCLLVVFLCSLNLDLDHLDY